MYVAYDSDMIKRVGRIRRISGSPFETVRADDGISRRDECISTCRGMLSRPGQGPLSGPVGEIRSLIKKNLREF